MPYVSNNITLFLKTLLKSIFRQLQSGEAWHHRRIARKAPTTPTPVAAVEMDMDRIESLEGEEARETGLSTTVSATCSSTTSGTAVTFASSVAASGGQFNYDDALQRLHTVVVVGRRHHMGGPGCPDGCGPDMFRKVSHLRGSLFLEDCNLYKYRLSFAVSHIHCRASVSRRRQ